MKLGFVINNDKASYVAKKDSIRLFSVAKETALNKQRIKPCVPLGTFWCFFGAVYAHLVICSLFLAITMKKNKIIRLKLKKNIIDFDKSG